MKDEIKEILDDLRKTADNNIFIVCSSQEELDKMPKYTANFLSINDRKAKLLLDYITNLQKEYEIELDENIKLSKWLVKKQKRIEKALEFLDNEYNYKKGDAKFNRTDYVIWQSLKNILNSDDNN